MHRIDTLHYFYITAVRTITGKSQGTGPDYGCNGDYFDCAGNDYVYNNEDGNDYTYNNKDGNFVVLFDTILSY